MIDAGGRTFPKRSNWQSMPWPGDLGWIESILIVQLLVSAICDGSGEESRCRSDPDPHEAAAVRPGGDGGVDGLEGGVE